LFFGLAFYILMYFILEVDLHFVHIWGIEFVLNIIVMHLVSMAIPRTNNFVMKDVGAVDLTPWKYAKHLSIILTVAIISIYIFLGKNG